MTRQQQRAIDREAAKTIGYVITGHGKKVGPGRRAKWLMRHPKVAGFYQMANGILSNGPRSQAPTWKAVKKMMVVLATQPRVNVIGVGERIPFIITQNFHERGSWRSYPSAPYSVNLVVH